MKKQFKKKLSIILVFAMLLSLMPVMTLPAGAGGDDPLFTYVDNGDGTATITGMEGSSTDIVLPSTIGEGLTVTKIGDSAFREKGLTSVVIPEGVIEIGEQALSFNSLTAIDIPDTVTKIGDYAFTTNSIDGSIELTENLQSLGWGAFSFNQIDTITLLNKFTDIRWMAFSNNDGITIQGYKNSSAEYFAEDSVLPFVSIDTEVNHEDGNTYYIYEKTPGEATLMEFEGGGSTEVVIPDTLDGLPVTKIFEGVFVFEGLTSVIVPEGVIEIGKEAFRYNEITSLNLPQSLAIIGEYAFDENQLTELTLPPNLTTIGAYAFYGNKLTTLLIPASVATIGTSAFNNNELYKVVILNNDVIIEEGAFASNQWPTANLKLYGYAGSGTEGYSADNGHTFAALDPVDGGWVNNGGDIYIYCNNEDETVTIKDFVWGVTTDVVIPATLDGHAVTKIGNAAFKQRGLTSVVIPEGVLEIGDEAFYGEGNYSNTKLPTNKLSTVTIPTSVVSIGQGAFFSQGYWQGEYQSWLTTLTEVNFAGGEDSQLTTIGDEAFAYNALPSLTISQNVTSIGESAFRGQNFDEERVLETLLFAGGENNKLETIGANAFRNNYLSNLDLPANLKTINSSAFAGNVIEALTLPEGLNFIDSWAFEVNKLTNVTIPASLTTIGEGVFSDNLITTVTIPVTVTSLGNYALAWNRITGASVLNPEVAFGVGVFSGQDIDGDLTVYGYAGSTAEAYATDNGHVFEALAGGGEEEPGSTLWAWGNNENGQLGDGNTDAKVSPVQIGDPEEWKVITTGNEHTVGIKTDGTLWAWGLNDYGKLGDGTTTTRHEPTQIGTDTDWKTVAVGWKHTVAIKNNGTLWGWGGNWRGQLGNGTKVNTSTPIQIGTDSDWKAVAAGWEYTMAIKNDGSLWGCGNNWTGRVGDGTTANDKAALIRIGTDNDWAKVAAGSGQTIATKADGSLWAWGDNWEGQVGDGTKTNRTTPDQIGTDTDWKDVFAGSYHSLALKTDGSLWAWGGNWVGQLGDGTETERLTPTRIGADTDWKAVAAGENHTVAIKNNDSLWVWGGNYNGQLGDGTNVNKTAPIQIGAVISWKSVAAGKETTLALGIAPPAQSAQSVTASATTSTPVAGANNAITLTVKDSLGNTDTGFNGAKDVSISGVEAAPNNTYGNFNGITLNADSAGTGQTISVTFTNGVATANLALNKAGAQTIAFSISGVATPAANTLSITPTADVASSMTLSTNITAPAANGGQFAQQPVITLKDAYGNTCTNDSTTEVTASKKDSGTWTLTGTTTVTAVNGIVTFAGLGATNAAQVLNAQLTFNAEGLAEVVSAGIILPAQSTGGGGGSSTTTSDSQNTGAEILVNGKTENLGTASNTKDGDRSVTTVTVDTQKIEAKLQSTGNNAVITIPVNTKADVVVGQLTGKLVKSMEQKDAVLEIKTGTVTYTLPASQINIDAVAEAIGAGAALSSIKVNVKIATPLADTIKIVENTANKNSYQIVVKPVQFNITCTHGNKTVDVSKFNGYVERTVAIPDGIDPSKITTGIVLNLDGTFSHVPTQIIIVNGKHYAKINSLTNSAYSVIWNPKEFGDVEKHWAKEAVNDMGSRLVVSGYAKDTFNPDKDITRAEFAAIMVRALGLKPGTGKTTFGDVDTTDWYAGFVETAYEYGLISGYGNDKFGPNDRITREQAMTMIAKAMKLTKLKVEFATGEEERMLKAFRDSGKAAEYARTSIATCVKSGIVTGKGSRFVAPKDNITRAEVAVIVRNLLKKSDLI